MSYSIFCNLVDELIKNLPPSNKTEEINLVLDNGAFNGLYLFGILIYLKKLESLKRIKINKISGSSIGATFAVLYLVDKLDITEPMFDKARGCWKENCNLQTWRNVLTDIANQSITNDVLDEKINGKVFINYFDTLNCKEVIKSQFNSKDELIDTLYKSSFIPVLINGELSYDNCIDGFNPMLFDERTVEDNKCLFVHLLQADTIIKSINVSNDKNPSFRAIEGINSIHKFFIGENQKLCSYVNDWSTKQLLYYRFRQIFYLMIVYLIKLLTVLKVYIPDSFYEIPVISFGSQFVEKLYKDIMFKICF